MDTYTHGHDESVLAHHAARTVATSARFLVPHLVPGMRVLDVGCGPGSITVELAGLVAPGEVVGVDLADEVLETARAAAADAGASNVRFRRDDIYALADADSSFDVVYAHQVLQHLTDPVGALVELRRVLVEGGILAVRDADYEAMTWAPAHPMLDRWLDLYHQVTAANGAEADAGRYLPTWVAAAGFTHLEVTTSNWTYATPDACRWWGEGWARRALQSAFASQAIEYELSNTEELEAIADAWQWWSRQPNAIFVIMHMETIGRA